jgi:hypothetical protein
VSAVKLGQKMGFSSIYEGSPGEKVCGGVEDLAE